MIGRYNNEKNALSLEHLHSLSSRLQKLLTKHGKRVDKELTSILKQFAEIMIHGEKVSDQYFDFFMEEKLLSDIISITYQNRSNATKLQVIQTVSILIQNIRNEKALFFILSNNHIDSLITAPLDFSDEDIVSQYISFIKMLSLSVNSQTIHFFNNNKNPANPFPLFSICSKFFDHSEGMIRIAVRTITFNCLRVKDESCIQFMSQPGPQKYFRQLVYYVLSLILTMNNLCEDNMYKEASAFAQNISDEFYILNDLIHCGIESVEKCIEDTIIKSILVNCCFPAIHNIIDCISPSSTHYELTCSTALRISTCIESFLLQNISSYRINSPSVTSESPLAAIQSTSCTIFVDNELKRIPLVQQQQTTSTASWEVCGSRLKKTRSTREVTEIEEKVDSIVYQPIHMTVQDDSHNCLFTALFLQLSDIKTKSQLLFCLTSMMKMRIHQTDVWKDHELLHFFLQSIHQDILLDVSRIMHSSSCSCYTLQLCLLFCKRLHQLNYLSQSDFDSCIHSLLSEILSTLHSLLLSHTSSVSLNSVAVISFLYTLRKYQNQFKALPQGKHVLSPLELNEHVVASNVWMVQDDINVINSSRFEDVEGMGIYEINQSVVMSKIPTILGKQIRSITFKILALLHALSTDQALPYLTKLYSLLPEESIQIGDMVKLNPSLQYIACNVMLSSAVKIPSNSTQLETIQTQLGKRLYNLPCYLFIGESQCGIVEVPRGNLSIGSVRILTKLYDVIDIAILKDSNRCLVITLQSDREHEFCVNRKGDMDTINRLIDKRYCFESKFYLRFISASLCNNTYKQLMNHRNLFFKNFRNKMTSLVNDLLTYSCN